MPDDHLWTFIVLYALSLILTMMFSFCYRAVYSGIESRLRKAADDGDRRSLALLSAMENSAKFERRALFAIFAFSALATVFAVAGFYPVIAKLSPIFESTAAKILLGALIALVSAVFTDLFVVEIPKFAAEQNPARAYAISAWIARPVFFILAPLSALSSFLSSMVLKSAGIRRDDAEIVTEDEILDMIDAGEESGNIEAAEKEMIENVFEFSDITASDVMTHRTKMEVIDVSDSDEEINRLIKETGFSRFPVFEDEIDNIIGVLYTREYLLDRMSGGAATVRELMHQPLVTPEQVRADVLFREMQQSNVHIAIVLDEYGGVSGLVTMEDLLEEIFGNIYDEFDEKEPLDIQQLGENLWRVAGDLDLETLADTIGCKFDDEVYEDYDTLGGLVFSSLSLIPDDGEQPHVQAFGLDIKVEVFADRRVLWATVSVIPEADTEENEA